VIKRIVLGALAVFVAWSILDFVIHSLILRSAYQSTPQLWRPEAEYRMILMYVTVLLASLAFSGLYGWFVKDKSVCRGLAFGLLYGFAVGVGMGYGSFSVMPLPYIIAFTWCWGTVIECGVAGLLVGLIIREPAA
jgi:hypothetical protein